MNAFRPSLLPLLLGSLVVCAAADKWNIVGRVSGLQDQSRATIKLTGAANRSAVTTTTGDYHFNALPPGTYELTPTHAHYTFTPESKTVTLSTRDQGGINFTAHKKPTPKFQITGTVSGLGPNHRATVKTTGKAIHTVTTASDGTYTFHDCVPGTYTIRVTRTGYTFTPSMRTVAVTDHDVSGRDFTAHLTH